MEGATWQPRELQALLLRATILKHDEAIPAWHAWRSRVDLDNLDEGSTRLFPETYTNLPASEIGAPFLKKMKELKRRTWLDNQLLFHHGEAVLSTLSDEGIATMVTKGAALVLRHYLDHGRRPMADFDIVVPSEMRAASCDVLERSGYQRFWSEGEETRPFSHAATYVNEMGRQFDIHWQLLTGCTDSRPFWSAAVPIRVGSTPSLVPSPSDLFLHVCAHGLRRNQVAPLRWIVDAAVIIQSQDFDWDRLELLAGKYRYSVLISEAVRVLSELGVAIPAHVTAKWSVLRLSKLERAEFDRTGGIRKKSVASQLASSWLGFGRFSGDGTPLRNLSQFPRYLQESWSTSSIWTVPGIAVSKTFRRAIPKVRAGINTKAVSQSKSNDADVR